MPSSSAVVDNFGSQVEFAGGQEIFGTANIGWRSLFDGNGLATNNTAFARSTMSLCRSRISSTPAPH